MSRDSGCSVAVVALVEATPSTVIGAWVCDGGATVDLGESVEGRTGMEMRTGINEASGSNSIARAQASQRAMRHRGLAFLSSDRTSSTPPRKSVALISSKIAGFMLVFVCEFLQFLHLGCAQLLVLDQLGDESDARAFCKDGC